MARPGRTLDDHLVDWIRQLYDGTPMTVREIARETGVSPSTVMKYTHNRDLVGRTPGAMQNEKRTDRP